MSFAAAAAAIQTRELANGMRVYVSKGAQYWGPPMRLGSRNEITIIDFKKWTPVWKKVKEERIEKEWREYDMKVGF